jgi:hypothetical protein
VNSLDNKSEVNPDPASLHVKFYFKEPCTVPEFLRQGLSQTCQVRATELDDICGTLISKINIVITTAKIPSVSASILFLLSTVSSSIYKQLGRDIPVDYLRLAYRLAAFPMFIR